MAGDIYQLHVPARALVSCGDYCVHISLLVACLNLTSWGGLRCLQQLMCMAAWKTCMADCVHLHPCIVFIQKGQLEVLKMVITIKAHWYHHHIAIHVNLDELKVYQG